MGCFNLGRGRRGAPRSMLRRAPGSQSSDPPIPPRERWKPTGPTLREPEQRGVVLTSQGRTDPAELAVAHAFRAPRGRSGHEPRRPPHLGCGGRCAWRTSGDPPTPLCTPKQENRLTVCSGPLPPQRVIRGPTRGTPSPRMGSRRRRRPAPSRGISERGHFESKSRCRGSAPPLGTHRQPRKGGGCCAGDHERPPQRKSGGRSVGSPQFRSPQISPGDPGPSVEPSAPPAEWPIWGVALASHGDTEAKATSPVLGDQRTRLAPT
jgi:hypothetical protein